MKHFHLGAVSGVIATAAANGVVFAWRNPSTTNVQYIQRVKAICIPITPPTSTNDQEFGLSLNTQSVFSANYTGGANLSDPATAADYAVRNRNLDVQRVLASAMLPASILASGNVRIATTGTLTAGGGDTIDAHAWAFNSIKVPGATASATGGANLLPFTMEWSNPLNVQNHQNPQQGCMILQADKGFIIRCPVAIANSMTVRVAVEVEWME